MQNIIVVDYDPIWPEAFERIRSAVWPVVSDIACSIEHVGSTSVPGLAAKSIIDLDIIVKTENNVRQAIERLATLGYLHRGDLGIKDREAFSSTNGLPTHNLYLCLHESVALLNHLAVRDYLRTHPQIVKEYGELKKQLAKEFPNDIDAYIDGKTDLLLRVLQSAKLPKTYLEQIELVNRKKV